MKISLKRILLHLLFWAFYVAFFGLFFGKYGKNINLHLLETSVMLPLIMLATYTTIYGILPYYLRTQKLLVALLALIFLLGSVTLGERIFLRLINGLPVTADSLFGITYIYLMLETNFMVGIAFAIRFYKIWIKQQEEKHLIEKKNLENELNLLRTQLHPHFLFNTMNNLYALSLENTTKTSEGIAKISDLLRAVLYECNEREILLDKEITLVRNYIDLEKMRYGNRLQLDFSVTGNTADWSIAPMVLFTFVENCFKHGCSLDPEKPFVRISLDANEKAMTFVVSNTAPKLEKVRSSKQGGGIGLNNVKKRLEILYPQKYELNYGSNNCCFEVFLKLLR